MFGNMSDLMKQAQQMQDKLQQLQQQVEALEVTGDAGAGLVQVTMTGRHDVTRVNIDAAVLGEDKAVLEDLLAAAVNNAVRKIESEREQMMGSLTGGMPLPPGFKMPF